MLANLNTRISIRRRLRRRATSRNLTAATKAQERTGRQNTDLLANQTAAQNKINSDIQASQGLTNTGDSMSKNNVANFNMLQSAGAGQSMQAQNEINSADR